MNIRVTKEVHEELLMHLAADRKISKFVEAAIREKIEREKLQENIILERQLKNNGK